VAKSAPSPQPEPKRTRKLGPWLWIGAALLACGLFAAALLLPSLSSEQPSIVSAKQPSPELELRPSNSAVTIATPPAADAQAPSPARSATAPAKTSTRPRRATGKPKPAATVHPVFGLPVSKGP
jgi:hypothetical protein